VKEAAEDDDEGSSGLQADASDKADTKTEEEVVGKELLDVFTVIEVVTVSALGFSKYIINILFNHGGVTEDLDNEGHEFFIG
jgi:hypothetical protein